MASDGHFIQVQSPSPLSADAPTLEWHNLELAVSVKTSMSKATETKRILSGVSGSARPGELLVIMGPSGVGKSSLLDCIAGRNRAATGVVTVNGAPWSKRIKRFSAYVMQDGLFYATITVREHLLFQAKLRMGKTCSLAQCTARVDTVLEELGLAKCRDTFIGGERKRLSFATEILTNPSMLFVDEPTSGLDSYMVETVVLQLQQLAHEGRTVIVTIHQPSSELFTLFDTLWAQAVRGTILAVTATASATRDLDIRLLRVLLRGLQDPDELPPQISTAETAYLLFFDGGSRGNPGPGGSGSVIVRLGTQPDIVWAGAMSYAQASTTNNIAEYQGLCTVLKVAEQHGWTPLEVVGDSMLIIRQMSRRQRPKANSLRPLYEQARTTADALRVRGWHHHYRSHNKMADKAANQAMDGGASYQAHAASGRPELDALRVWFHNDVHHWILAQATAPTPV